MSNYSYYSEYNGMSVEEYVDKYIYSSEEEMERMQETLNLLPKDVDSVLDVGAGHGVFLEMLYKQKGIKGIGVEITDKKIEYAKKNGIDMRKGDAANLQFPDNSFDAVVCCEVIEHLPFGLYEKALVEMFRVSRRYIVISVPYNEKREFVKCPYCGATSNPSYHLRSFSEKKMKHLMVNSKHIKLVRLGVRRKSYIRKLLRSWRKISWPVFAICPSCGFKEKSIKKDLFVGPKVFQETTSKSIINIITKKLLNSISRKKPKWIIALYEKLSQ